MISPHFPHTFFEELWCFESFHLERNTRELGHEADEEVTRSKKPAGVLVDYVTRPREINALEDTACIVSQIVAVRRR